MEHYHVSEEEYLLDRYNVLGAIRLPADMTSSYRMDSFENAFLKFFEIVKKKNISGTQRTLYLMKRKS